MDRVTFAGGDTGAWPVERIDTLRGPPLAKVARVAVHELHLAPPFDFLTWFEYAPADRARFDELLATLRAGEEWQWIDREVHVRLAR